MKSIPNSPKNLYIQKRPECRIKRGAFKSVKRKKSAFEEELGDVKGDPDNLERTNERFSCVVEKLWSLV